MKRHRVWIEIVLLGTTIACVVALLIATVVGAAAGAAVGTHVAPQTVTRPDRIRVGDTRICVRDGSTCVAVDSNEGSFILI
jgi:hypothetical protein